MQFILTNKITVEREAVKVAIESTNRRQRSSDIRFEPWAWEDDAVSGIGSTPQDVIDRQTPEYDVYIGIMWKRFGTPTSRAGSGTEHEFRFALDSYRSKNMPSHVMFFFKTEIDGLENLDIAEYAKVDSFKKELGKLGVLHHTFRSSDDLEKILDVALARVVEESSNSVSSENSSINVSEVLVDRDDDSEMGYFELLDRGQESMSRCSALLQKIGELLTEMGAATESHTAEMISKKDKNGKIPQQIARIETDKACGDIEKFTKYATPLLDEALSRFEESFTAYSSVLVMEQTAGFTQDPEETARFKEAQHSLIESLNVADNGMASLAAVFNGMIKFSVRFGHARRDLLRFISRFQSANSRIRSLCFNLLGIAEAIHASSTKRISTSE